MQCQVMTQLIRKLDTVRAEHCDAKGNLEETNIRKRLRSIESFLDYHEQTCVVCQRMNPGGTGFVKHATRPKL